MRDAGGAPWKLRGSWTFRRGQVRGLSREEVGMFSGRISSGRLVRSRKGSGGRMANARVSGECERKKLTKERGSWGLRVQ